MDQAPLGTPTLIDPLQPVPPPAPSGKRHRLQVIAGVLLSLALLAAAIAIGEWAARVDEMNALVGRIEQSELAMTTTGVAVGRVLGPEGLTSGTPTQDSLDELATAAQRGRDAVAQAGQQVEAVPIQPWHHDQLAAQQAYLAHNQAWQDFLTRAATDPSLWYSDDPDIESTWDAMIPLLRAAVPTPSILGIDDRVEAIINDGGGEGDDGGTSGGGGGLDA